MTVKPSRWEIFGLSITLIVILACAAYLRSVMLTNRAVGYQLRADQMTTAQLLEGAVAHNSSLRRAEFNELRHDLGFRASTRPTK